MSKIDEYINKRSAQSPVFAKAAKDTDVSLEIAVEVRELRESLGMTQREFGDLIGKPQSTVGRIENATTNVSTQVLADIAAATNRHLTIQFVPA